MQKHITTAQEMKAALKYYGIHCTQARKKKYANGLIYIETRFRFQYQKAGFSEIIQRQFLSGTIGRSQITYQQVYFEILCEYAPYQKVKEAKYIEEINKYKGIE